MREILLANEQLRGFLGVAHLIDGCAVSRRLDQQSSAGVAELAAYGPTAPGLAVVPIGSDPASGVYIAHKIKTCSLVGIGINPDEVGRSRIWHCQLPVIDSVLISRSPIQVQLAPAHSLHPRDDLRTTRTAAHAPNMVLEGMPPDFAEASAQT